MLPVFTKQQAALQHADADRWALQVTLQHNKSQGRNIVRAFAWHQDDCEPVSFDFTLSLGSCNFQVTESMLHDLELICMGDVTHDLIWLQKYDTAEGL